MRCVVPFRIARKCSVRFISVGSPGARIYGHEGSAQHSAGPGDPALASDQLLFEHLVEAGRLDLAQSVNSTAGCRADCVERPSAMARCSIWPCSRAGRVVAGGSA
jgi:hypothetical protein